MSRSGYTDEVDDQWQFIMWRGRVASSIRGKRGQAFLRELIEALDALPEKKLIKEDLRKDGAVCAIGAVGVKRGIELEKLDINDYDTIAGTFGIASCLVQEIEWVNDESGWRLTPEERWSLVRKWAEANIALPTPSKDNQNAE